LKQKRKEDFKEYEQKLYNQFEIKTMSRNQSTVQDNRPWIEKCKSAIVVLDDSWINKKINERDDINIKKV
jgi:hypothetical protein